jgi:hypothetical protein
MGIGKSHALARQFVDMRSLDLAIFRIETLHIPIAQIVTHDQDDIGAALPRTNTGAIYGKYEAEERLRFNNLQRANPLRDGN